MADPKVWENKDFQYNTITYGFDVRSGIPVDRRFVLTREQMEVLSKPPYSVMMPSNYFCVLRGGAEDEGTTKVYVYNRDQEFVELSEGNVLEFPLKIGKFRLYNEGNPVVIPEDEYGRPETPLPVNEETGNTELTFASSEGYGLVIINGKMMELDETGMLKPRNFYRTQHLEKTDDLPDSSMFKNPNTIYYLTDDDPDNPDYISGLYAYDGNIYVPIGGRPVDENTMELNEEGKLSVHPKFPLVKGRMDGSEGDRGLFIIPDPSALEIVDEGLSVKLAPGNIIEKTSEGLDLKIDPESLWKDNEGELAVKLDPEGMIHRSPEGLEVYVDDAIFSISEGKLKLNFTEGDVLHRDSEGIKLHYEDYLINSEGVLWVKLNNKGVIHRVGTPSAADFGFDVVIDDQSLQNSEVGGIGTLRVKIKNGDVIHRTANGLETWFDPQSTLNSEGRIQVKLDPKGMIHRSPNGLQLWWDSESLINSEGELQVRIVPTGALAKGPNGLYLNLSEGNLLNSEGKLRVIDFTNATIEVVTPGGAQILSGVDALNALNLYKIRNVFDGLYFVDNSENTKDLHLMVDIKHFNESPSSLPSDGGNDFHGTIRTNWHPDSGDLDHGTSALSVIDLYNDLLRVKSQYDNSEIHGGVSAINELNRQLGPVYLWPEAFSDSEFTPNDVDDAIKRLLNRVKQNKIVAHDAIKLASEGLEGTKIDVLFDAKLINGGDNTTDPTIRLTTTTEIPGANRLRAIDFKSDKLKVVNDAGTKLTSGVDAINALNSEIGPYNKVITTSEGNRQKDIKGVLNWLDNKISDFVIPKIEAVERNPIYVSNKNTYWANRTDAETNPLYITSEHTLHDKYLHMYDYPVKDVKITFNNNAPNAGSIQTVSIVEDKDSTTNGNEARIVLNSEFGVYGTTDRTITLKLDSNKSFIRSNNGELKTNILASEGLIYYTTPGQRTVLGVDIDKTRGVLGFTNNKLDIPWVTVKPTTAERDKIMAIDSQGNAIWVENVNSFDGLINKPKIDGVVLRGASEGDRWGMTLYELHTQRRLQPQDISIIITSEGNGQRYDKIKANYAGTNDITVSAGATSDIKNRSDTYNPLIVNHSYKVISFNPSTLYATIEDTITLNSNTAAFEYNTGGYARVVIPSGLASDTVTRDFASMVPNTSYSMGTITFSGTMELNGTGSYRITGVKSGITVTSTGTVKSGTVPTMTRGGTTGVVVSNVKEAMLVGHENSYNSTDLSYSTPGYYKISTDRFGHVSASDTPLSGKDAIVLNNNGEIEVLYDDLIGDSEATIALRQSGPNKYLYAKDVIWNGVGSARGTLLNIIPPGAGTKRVSDPTKVNDLVDYDTLMDVMAANLGTFRGTYDTTAALEAAWPYSTAADAAQKNDYAFVTIVTSEYTYYDRYKCIKSPTGNNWEFEFRIATSGFTASQWKALQSLATAEDIADLKAHIRNTNNPHSVTKAQVGLGNVDNTSDANKPVSTAQQAALNLKQDKLTAGNFINIAANNTITTTYTGEKDIAISTTGAIGHSNTAITATTSEYIYPVKLDAYGHVTQYGRGFNTRSKQDTLPGYNFNTKKFSTPNKYLHTNSQGTPEWVDVQQGSSEDGLPKPYVADTFLFSANTTQAGVQWRPVKINGISINSEYTAEQLNLQPLLSATNQLNPDFIFGLHTVARTGNYNDLTNKPTIPTVPTNVSAFTNDAGYLTAHQSLANYATISYVDAHANDTTKHVTATEKATWNNKQDKLTATNGIKITGTTISHTNAVTAGTLTGKASNTAANIATLTWDAQGHLTSTSTNTAYIPFTAGTNWQYWGSTGSGAQWQTPVTAWPNNDSSTNTSQLAASSALFKHMSTAMAKNYTSHRNLYIGALSSVPHPIVGDVCLVPIV